MRRQVRSRSRSTDRPTHSNPYRSWWPDPWPDTGSSLDAPPPTHRLPRSRLPPWSPPVICLDGLTSVLCRNLLDPVVALRNLPRNVQALYPPNTYRALMRWAHDTVPASTQHSARGPGWTRHGLDAEVEILWVDLSGDHTRKVDIALDLSMGNLCEQKFTPRHLPSPLGRPSSPRRPTQWGLPSPGWPSRRVCRGCRDACTGGLPGAPWPRPGPRQR